MGGLRVLEFKVFYALSQEVALSPSATSIEEELYSPFE